MNKLICPKCESSDIKKHEVDDRHQFTCKNCNNRWYSNRDRTGGLYTFLDEIADEVAKTGKAKRHIGFVLNFDFNDPHKNINDWCLSHGFSHSKDQHYYYFEWDDHDVRPVGGTIH